jgi:hypothetical protein
MTAVGRQPRSLVLGLLLDAAVALLLVGVFGDRLPAA